MKKHKLQWFIERIGKKIFRTKSQCNCMVCTDVFKNGVIVADKSHAQYMYDCQNDLDLYYFDEKPNL